MENQTIYERLGGEGAIEAAVEIFYDKILNDNRINHLFEDVFISILKEHQKRFLKYAFGGTKNYSGKSLRMAHAHLVEEKGLNEDHFNAVAENLQNTLKELNVPEDLIEEIMTLVGGTKDDVLGL